MVVSQAEFSRGADRSSSGGSGLSLFARFAVPPNQLGHCGPDEHEALLAYARTGVIDPRLAVLARAFEGPLPYLRALAAATPQGDPFARDVVEAYWIGGDLLASVDPQILAAEVEATFRGQPTVSWDRVEAALPHAAAHHIFHVLVTYPWLGLLDHPAGHAIGVLDRCRVRTGTVEDVAGDTVRVRSQPLIHRNRCLALGPAEVESVSRRLEDAALVPGDRVALHWDWLCLRLTHEQAQHLETTSREQIHMVNRVLLARDHRGPAEAGSAVGTTRPHRRPAT